MTYIKRLLLIGIILVSCVGCDQLSKTIAENHLPQARLISYLGDTFRLQYIENKVAFLSLGATMPDEVRFWVLIVFTASITVGTLVFVLTKRNLRTPLVIGLTLMVGGGIGNLIDRIANKGAVIDFMNIGLGNVRTGIFNVADVAIMIGIGMVVFAGSRRPGKEQA